MKIQARAQQLGSVDLEIELWEIRNDQRDVISAEAAVTIASWYQAPGGVGATFAAFASGVEVDAADLMDAIHRTMTGGESAELSQLAAWVFVTFENETANNRAEAGRQQREAETATNTEDQAK